VSKDYIPNSIPKISERYIPPPAWMENDDEWREYCEELRTRNQNNEKEAEEEKEADNSSKC
jgi:hypothetical protein